MFKFTLILLLTILSHESFAQTQVQFTSSKKTELNGIVVIDAPAITDGSTSTRLSADSSLNGVCKSYGLGAYVKHSLEKKIIKMVTMEVDWKGESSRYGKDIGYLYSEYRAIESIQCVSLEGPAAPSVAVKELTTLDKVIRGAKANMDQVNPMPNILEDSKTGDYFGFHCFVNHKDGFCKSAQAFYYCRENGQYYLYGRVMNAELINSEEFKKNWNWSNQTKKVKHFEFIRTVERFTL